MDGNACLQGASSFFSSPAALFCLLTSPPGDSHTKVGPIVSRLPLKASLSCYLFHNVWQVLMVVPGPKCSFLCMIWHRSWTLKFSSSFFFTPKFLFWSNWKPIEKLWESYKELLYVFNPGAPLGTWCFSRKQGGSRASPWRAPEMVLMVCVLGFGECRRKLPSFLGHSLAHHHHRPSLTSNTLSSSFSIPAFFSVALSREKLRFNE